MVVQSPQGLQATSLESVWPFHSGSESPFGVQDMGRTTCQARKPGGQASTCLPHDHVHVDRGSHEDARYVTMREQIDKKAIQKRTERRSKKWEVGSAAEQSNPGAGVFIEYHFYEFYCSLPESIIL